MMSSFFILGFPFGRDGSEIACIVGGATSPSNRPAGMPD